MAVRYVPQTRCGACGARDDHRVAASTVLAVLLVLHVITLVLVALPAVRSLGTLRQLTVAWRPDGTATAFADSPRLFVRADILSILEPFISTVLYVAVMAASGVARQTQPLLRPLLSLRAPCISLCAVCGGHGAGRFTSHPLVIGMSYDALGIVLLFAASLALYGQGAGLHTASTMLKRPAKDLLTAMTTARATELASMPAADYDFTIEFLTGFVHWARDTWEHAISHYTYAAGALLLGFSIVVAYDGVAFNEDRVVNTNTTENVAFVPRISTTSRDDDSDGATYTVPAAAPVVIVANAELPDAEPQDTDPTPPIANSSLGAVRALFYANAAVYATLVALVAVDFPAGTIVVFATCLVYGVLFLGVWIVVLRERMRNGVSWHIAASSLLVLRNEPHACRSVIAKTYALGMMLAVVAIIVWVAVKGGFVSRSS